MRRISSWSGSSRCWGSTVGPPGIDTVLRRDGPREVEDEDEDECGRGSVGSLGLVLDESGEWENEPWPRCGP